MNNVDELNKRVIYLENAVQELELILRTIEKYANNHYMIMIKDMGKLESQVNELRGVR